MLITTASAEEAVDIGKTLVEKRLAACCSIIPNIQSIYWWDNKISEDAEVLLMVKTIKSVEVEIYETVKAMHSYKVPEMISVDLAGGFEKYFAWIDENVSELR